MATSQVYSSTTAPNPKASWFVVPSDHLDKARFGIKVGEVLMSFVAFILEEVVSSCINCPALYFFEFVSCTAFLFTLLLLILLSTPLHTRVGITCWSCLDFVYTAGIAVLFLVASIVFAVGHGGSSEEKLAVVFGFVATVLFIVDLFLFVKSQGFPFKREVKMEPGNGIAVAEPQSETETEKLNASA